MRILIKGGVWKNSEDEVLKAAVMKYGLNNWSRVASLLARKSPKQCKARWYEWLDPSVKKTEWTREEEEKLLHLAKLFPTQWRTIAPIVGRTAYQCLEHYEKLLDQAQGRDEMDENDPRRLKPGEIDPHPETKPARADPIDMDEDEKEMLSEARARLANTRGKKAKRKAREKQLEEARRLAALQKRRELKAAGVSTSRKYKSSKRIDYGTEVPFEAAPPMGFHATGAEETPKVTLGMRNMTLQAVEDRNREADERRRRKDDERKLKRLKAENLPQAIEMISKLNDPQALRRRTALSLPAPQLNDEELEQIVKMGADAAALAAQSADSATAGLVQSYGETPGMTPLRTPQQQNTILMEAQNAIARNSMQTPLFGESNPMLNATDWSGVLPTPKNAAITPNLYAEQARSGMTPGPGATPLHGRTPAGAITPRPGATPGGSGVGTPAALRDGLALNQAEDEEEQMPLKMRLQRQRMEMQAALQGLPAPVNEVEISMPDLMDEGPTGDDALEEDAADIDKRRHLLEQARLEIERQKQSKAVQMGLPRPAQAQLMAFEPTYGQTQKQNGVTQEATAVTKLQPTQRRLLAEAEALLHQEMEHIIARDALLHPVKGARPAPKRALEELGPEPSLEELKEASDILSNELDTLEAIMGTDAVQAGAVLAAEDGNDQFVFLPHAKSYMDWRYLARPDRIEACKNMFELAEAQLQRDEKRVKKLEEKVSRVLGGYMGKAKQSLSKIKALAEERESVTVEIDVFRTLRSREEQAIKTRVEELEITVQREKERNSQFQQRFRALQVLQQKLDQRLA